jgi:hypothetical protein
MAQNDMTELAQQGNSKAIASLLSQILGDGVTVQSGFKGDICVVRATSDEPLDETETVQMLQAFFGQLQCSKVQQCIVQSVVKGESSSRWNRSFDILVVPAEAEIVAVEEPAPVEPDEVAAAVSEPNAEASELSTDSEIVPVAAPEMPESNGGKWRFPGMKLGNLQKMSGQMTEQAVKMVQETASTAQDTTFKATEQAMRSSINQTMNAFQIAVEEIRARKLPAEKTALTGTINVGIIQLSICLDIPMDQETGEIAMDIQ